MDEHNKEETFSQLKHNIDLTSYNSCIKCNNFSPNCYNPAFFTEVPAIPRPSNIKICETKAKCNRNHEIVPLFNKIGDVENQVVQYLPGLVCLECNNCVAVYQPEDKINCKTINQNSHYRSVEDILMTSDNNKEGWNLANEDDDLFRHLVLSFVVYRMNEPPNPTQYEANYDAPVRDFDSVLLLWEHGRAVGFATIRSKDYSMVILDTIFVRKSHRGKGYTKSLINDLIASPDVLIHQSELVHSTSFEHSLGFSSPISNGMFCLLARMILEDEKWHKNTPTDRAATKEKLWLVENLDDNPRNIWWSAAKISRERKLDLKQILKIKTK